MRLPGRKIWRAFPELDRFSDEQCERFVLRARQEYAGRRVGVMALSVMVLAVLVPAVIGLARMVWALVDLWVLHHAGLVYDFVTSTGGRVAMVFALGLACCLSLLGVRDWWLRRTVNRRIRRTDCACGYTLLGLTPDRGVVTCPECNRPFFLDDAGLTEEDLTL